MQEWEAAHEMSKDNKKQQNLIDALYVEQDRLYQEVESLKNQVVFLQTIWDVVLIDTEEEIK